MKNLGSALAVAPAEPFGAHRQTLPAANYTVDMLQRTMMAPEWPDRVDYIVVERKAREMRNQYIAGLFGRAKKALAHRFARGARRSIGHAR